MPSLRSLASLALWSLVTADSTTYHLNEAFEGKNILNSFVFHEGGDPTNGFVQYVNQSYALDTGLAKITDAGSFYMGVDHETVLSPDSPGRYSVRVETSQFYQEGLYILDIAHMPGSICGTWPAFWSVGPKWPYDGEIDIIEGVNKHSANEIVLHTSGSCNVAGEHDMTGTLTSGECGDASGTIGCVVEGAQGSSGDPFNAQGGGLYVMEWTETYLKIWFLPRASIPASITQGNPDTSTFGTPMAHLEGTCNFHERFSAQKFILDTTFCGDWAGNVFADSGCPMSDASSPMKSCEAYVAANPSLFKDAYWEINSFKIFKQGAAKAVPEQATTATTETTTAPTTEQTTTAPTTTEKLSTTTRTTTTTTTSTTTTTTTTTTTATSKTTTTTTTTTTPASPADVEPADSDSDDSGEVTKITQYVTRTTTICPYASTGLTQSAPTAAAVESESTSTTSEPPAAVETSSQTTEPCKTFTSEIVVPTTIEIPPSQPVVPSSVAPTSSPEPAWTIVPSETVSVVVPTDTSSSAPVFSGTPTVPSTPVFTGSASRFSVGVGMSVVCALMAMLA